MLRVTGLCEGNLPLIGEFPAQRASNAKKMFPFDDVIITYVCIERRLAYAVCTHALRRIHTSANGSRRPHNQGLRDGWRHQCSWSSVSELWQICNKNECYTNKSIGSSEMSKGVIPEQKIHSCRFTCVSLISNIANSILVHNTTHKNWIEVTILVYGWCQGISSKSKCSIRVYHCTF